MWCTKAPFTAPPYLDRVWKALILYNYTYEEFSQKACGAFIDREDPKLDIEGSFENYKKTLEALDANSKLLKPYPNLWPRYENSEQFKDDYCNWTWTHPDIIPKIINDMMKELHKAKVTTLDIAKCRELAAEMREKYTEENEPSIPKITPIKGFESKHEFFKKRKMDPREAFKYIHSYKMPKGFKSILMKEQMI
jgi:hypothetical protein